MEARELWETGNLGEAVQAATEDVRSHPGDTARRLVLAELLLFAGDLERADRQFEAIIDKDAKIAFEVSVLRHLVRAEKARQEFFQAGRVPEFLDAPAGDLELRLRAAVLLREGDSAEAGRLLEEADASRTRVRGTCDGESFDDLRDLDDLTASYLEVLTATGKYFWIPIERIELLEFQPPKSLRDLLWRAARLDVRGGPDGVVYIPSLYAGSHREPDDRLRLGRATDWRADANGFVRGIGQRTYLVGERDLPIGAITQIEVSGDGAAEA